MNNNVRKYKVIGIEPWVAPDGQTAMTRLYCVTPKEGVAGLATVASSIVTANMPTDVTLNSYVLLGFERQGKYLEFVYVLNDEKIPGTDTIDIK